MPSDPGGHQIPPGINVFDLAHLQRPKREVLAGGVDAGGLLAPAHLPAQFGAPGDRDSGGQIALARVGLTPKMVGVLNDAELAAASAGLLPEAAGKTLVLTLGFGLGAALLDPAAP